MPRRGAYLYVNLGTSSERTLRRGGFAYHHDDVRRCKRILALVQADLAGAFEVRCILARDLGDFILRIDGHLRDMDSADATTAIEVRETNMLARAHASDLDAEAATRPRTYKRGAYIYLDVGQGLREPLDPYGFVFYHEDARLVRRIVYAAGDWFYNRTAICRVVPARNVGLGCVEADDWIDFHTNDPEKGKMFDCIEYIHDLLHEDQSRRAKPVPAPKVLPPSRPVEKLDGWTKQELISQAGTEWEGFSASTFDRLRKDANVDGGQKGGSGAHHRYAPRELKLIIEAAERRGRTSGNREYAAVAKAWRQLIPHESSEPKA
ncbi:MAG TPA: hypothetical protein VK157_14050 [Phycisphaerales bacterium]|nr:hypothetical protein [Phycisphaerales bacterium]